MFAINHAATALLLKKRYRQVRMVWLLLSVQLVELLWVVFNLIGLERTTTDEVVHSLADIHLIQMPFSHSLLATVLLAGGAWAFLRFRLGKPTLAVAVAVGISSHIVLDLATHGADLPLWPGADAARIGSGLYTHVPLLAFGLETVVATQ